MKIFHDHAEKDSCTNTSKANFYKKYFLAIRKQVTVSVEERLEQTESHTAIFSFLDHIPALMILKRKV